MFILSFGCLLIRLNAVRLVLGALVSYWSSLMSMIVRFIRFLTVVTLYSSTSLVSSK